MGEKVKKVVSRVLIGFVLVTTGYLAGRESAIRSSPPGAHPAGGAVSAAAEQVKVYYLHATIRCVTCNTIEAMTKRILDTRFADQMSSGKIVWESADWQADEALAKRYEVTSSGVVVVRRKDGRDVEFQRLDKVWTLMDTPEAFDAYIADAITGYLRGGSGL